MKALLAGSEGLSTQTRRESITGSSLVQFIIKSYTLMLDLADLPMEPRYRCTSSSTNETVNEETTIAK